MTLAAEIVAEEAALEPLREEWDSLAVMAGRPFCSPAWMLAWWRHARPRDARLRVIAVRRGERLLGVAPLWVRSDPLRGPSYHVLSGGLAAPIGPISVSGAEEEVASTVAAALADAGPPARMLRLSGLDRRAGWPAMLASQWPGGPPWVHSTGAVVAPIVMLEGHDYESWLAAKTKNFRQQARRYRRRLEADGARFEVARPDSIDRALKDFSTLHRGRWRERGGSTAMIAGIEAMLADVAGQLGAAGRFRVATLEIGGRVISAQLFVAAGGEVSYWNGGFDERAERYKPALQTLLFAVGDAMERGNTRMDLGPGAQDYKLRLADGEEAVETVTLVPRGAAYRLSRLRLSSYEARWALSRRLSPQVKRRVRGLLRR